MAKLDEFGNLDYSDPSLTFTDPLASSRVRNPQPGEPGYIPPGVTPTPQGTSGQNITDPAYDPGAPTPTTTPKPPPTFTNTSTVPQATTGAPGTTQGGSPNAPAGSRMDEAGLRYQIQQWAKMPGADPSLANDEDYWVRTIMAKGGLGQDNLKYWQDASVGPTAFFNNPNREGAAGGGSAGPSSSSALSSFLTNWLNNPDTASTANRNQMLSRLLGLADQYAQPVTADDPIIKANTDAYHGQTARAVQQFRTMAAERAHAEGTGTGSFDASIGNAENAAGRSEAGFTGTLMSNELASRRQNLQGILTQAGSLMSDQDRADLQSKISAIDGLLRGQSNDITSQLGNKSLDNQNNQFYDKLGTDNAFSQEQLDYLFQTLGLR